MVGYVCQLLMRHANCAQCFSTLWRKAKKKVLQSECEFVVFSASFICKNKLFVLGYAARFGFESGTNWRV